MQGTGEVARREDKKTMGKTDQVKKRPMQEQVKGHESCWAVQCILTNLRAGLSVAQMIRYLKGKMIIYRHDMRTI